MKLSKDDTSSTYSKINKVAHHLANKTKNTEALDGEIKKKAYYSIRANLRKAFLKYDRETKLAIAIQDLAKLDKYLTMSNTPKLVWTDAPKAIVSKKAVKKTTAKSKRI